MPVVPEAADPEAVEEVPVAWVVPVVWLRPVAVAVVMPVAAAVAVAPVQFGSDGIDVIAGIVNASEGKAGHLLISAAISEIQDVASALKLETALFNEGDRQVGVAVILKASAGSLGNFWARSKMSCRHSMSAESVARGRMVAAAVATST